MNRAREREHLEPQQGVPMLTYDDIRSFQSVNGAAAKAAMENSEKRLADLIEVRKASDAKHVSLFWELYTLLASISVE